MSAKKSRESAAPEPQHHKEELREYPGSGTGAASALERMKAERALRHKRQNGGRTAGPEHDEEPTAGR